MSSSLTLSQDNVIVEMRRRAILIEKIGPSIKGLSGVALIESLKRDRVGAGPYPDVTLFEAANRIMSDLVILHGVKWLLGTAHFPFDEYRVQLGHENTNPFDIEANNGRESLAGEAFNVAASFFQVKKSAMLVKLRRDAPNHTYRIIMVNHDAVTENYKPRVQQGEQYVFVNVGASSCDVVPKHLPQRSAPTSRR